MVIKEVKNTPFVAVMNDQDEKDKHYRIALGNQIVSEEKFATFTDAVKFINKKPWMLIATTACILAQNIVEQANANKK